MCVKAYKRWGDIRHGKSVACDRRRQRNFCFQRRKLRLLGHLPAGCWNLFRSECRQLRCAGHLIPQNPIRAKDRRAPPRRNDLPAIRAAVTQARKPHGRIQRSVPAFYPVCGKWQQRTIWKGFLQGAKVNPRRHLCAGCLTKVGEKIAAKHNIMTILWVTTQAQSAAVWLRGLSKSARSSRRGYEDP